MNVLSLFDGMSCGQIALNRAGIKIDNYYASEIETHAMGVTQNNFIRTIQVGDVTKLDSKNFLDVNLLIGGSPCQGFSTAGKQLNFNDPRSKLFFEYVRLLKDIKPKYFLLENVKMKKDYENIITSYLEVEPIEINSGLISAQDRKRLYWTNIPGLTQPDDRNIYLKDILEPSVNESLYLKPWVVERYYENKNFSIVNGKSCVMGKLSEYQGDRVFSVECKGSSLSANGGNNGGGGCNLIFDPISGRLRRLSVLECERLQTVPEGYSRIESNNNRYKMLGNGWTVDVITHIFSLIK